MNNNNQGHPNNGVGFAGMLAILFIALKLLGYISWSWVWVLSPIWISFLLYILLFAIGIIVAIIAYRR